MELQKRVIEQYLTLNPRATFKSISQDTGIQMTRVFRIMNGSQMKLCEYESFRKRVASHIGLSSTLEELAIESSIKLSKESVKEIELVMKNKLAIWSFKQMKNTTINNLA